MWLTIYISGFNNLYKKIGTNFKHIKEETHFVKIDFPISIWLLNKSERNSKAWVKDSVSTIFWDNLNHWNDKCGAKITTY